MHVCTYDLFGLLQMPPKKDPNAPKKPPTSYMMFQAAKRDEVCNPSRAVMELLLHLDL